MNLDLWDDKLSNPYTTEDLEYMHLNMQNIYKKKKKKRRPRGTSSQTLASHRWGPEFASRSLHLGFVVDETGSGQVFHGVSPVSPYHKFHSTISPHSSHPFRFISSALVMVRQAWSAGTLPTHGSIIQGLHRISSLDPTRVEDIFYKIHQSGGKAADLVILILEDGNLIDVRNCSKIRGRVCLHL